MFSGKLQADLDLEPVDRQQDRIMLCGSSGLLTDYNAWLDAHEWTEGNNTHSGQYVIEKAFVVK